jgi:hypothetical protein
MQIRDVRFFQLYSKKNFNIYCVPDCHFGSPAFLESEYERLAKIIENDPDALLIFQGDVLDANRPSTRKIKKIAYHDRMEEYEQEDEKNYNWIDNIVLPKLKRLIKNPERCLGMLDGDHFLTMSNGLSSTQYLCSKLKVPYLGDGQAVIRMHLHSGKFGTIGNKLTYNIHVQHGIGGGGRPGTIVNKLEDTANIWNGIDAFFRGHSHKACIYPISRYYVPQKLTEIRQKDVWLVNTPSFRTGFIMGRTDYAESRNYPATAHKFPVLHLTFSKDRADNYNQAKLRVSGELI